MSMKILNSTIKKYSNINIFFSVFIENQLDSRYNYRLHKKATNR